MKKLYSALVLFFIVASSMAQTPMHFNTNAAGGANAFPFANAATSRKVTWFIPPNSLTGLGPGNMITHVYFQLGSTTTRTYPIFNIKLKTGTGTGLTGIAAGPCETGLTVVYNATNLTINSTAGAWYQFALQTPWLYNPAVPLIVEVEHNSTTAGGSTVYQAVNIPGPGNGRQWADYNAINNTGVGTNQVNFGVDVVPATPCAGTPSANAVVTPTAPICPNNSTQLSLATQYSLGGITYQWQYSNVSAVGPWTNVPNGTSPYLITPSLTAIHYFNTIITCTNSSGSVTATSGTVDVASTTTNSIPYYEGFEGIGTPNFLPNCSWNASHPGTTCLTYTSVQNLNRSARTGGSYGSFYFTPSNNNFFWTNGIWMEAGVTYSAAMWYKTTEANINPTWQLRMWLSPAQTPTAVGATTIATTGGPGSAASAGYMPFSNTFSVTTSGYYHLGVNGVSNGAATSYLSWDDLEITLPCDLNPVPVTVSANSQTICSGASVNITANGADTYLWNTSATTAAILVSPNSTTTYAVTGTNALTGCSQTEYITINVLPSPIVSAMSTASAVCAGKPINLVAFGNADTYLWSNSTAGANITVSPLTSTSYTVTGSNSLGCSSSAIVSVVVNQLPNITASGDNAGVVCEEDVTLLTANGATTYQWATSSSFNLGNPISVSPNQSTTYTVTGTDQNGCSNTTLLQLQVTSCVGLRDVSTTSSGVKLYPNPNNGNFVIETRNKKPNTIVVSDLAGRVLYNHTSSDEKITIDLSAFSNGVYYVKISSGSNPEVVKIVKH